MLNYTSLKVCIIIIQIRKLIISPTNDIRAKVAVLVPAMVAVAPHLIRICKDSVYKRCKPNLDNHAPAGCPNRKHPAKQQCMTHQYDTSTNRNWSNGHNDPALQLSASTTKPDHISQLLEVTRKMTRYFIKYHKNGKSHQVNTDNNCSCKSESNSHNLDKHVHNANSNTDHVNKVTGKIQSLKGTNQKLKTHLTTTTPIVPLVVLVLHHSE